MRDQLKTEMCGVEVSEHSKIEWTRATFNPWWGCVKVSPGCDHCYAEREALRYGHDVWGADAGRWELTTRYWEQPRKWNQKAEAAGERWRVFCGSHCDVMEEGAHLQGIREGQLYPLIEATPWLDWLLLTKRPQNFRRFLPAAWLANPLPNVMGMTSVENADYLWRVAELLKTPFARRGLSLEPLLGPVNLVHIDRNGDSLNAITGEVCSKVSGCICEEGPWLDWVIVGGESGSGARPIRSEWAQSIRDSCVAEMTKVPFFFKQWGEWCEWDQLPGDTFRALAAAGEVPRDAPYCVGKTAAGALLDGREWRETP